MDLETTIAFVEIREMDKKAAAIAGLPLPVLAVNLWQPNEESVESNSVTESELPCSCPRQSFCFAMSRKPEIVAELSLRHWRTHFAQTKR